MKGWRNESARHSLAARGLKTPHKSWHNKKMSVVKQFQIESDISGRSEMIIWPNPRANKIADKVLVDFIHNKDDIESYLRITGGSSNLIIVPFLNGRERGYTARLGEKEVSWCEHRNSDTIVVYPFDWFGKNIGENFRTKTREFGKDDEKAYQFIIEHLGVDLR